MLSGGFGLLCMVVQILDMDLDAWKKKAGDTAAVTGYSTKAGVGIEESNFRQVSSNSSNQY
jgi:hypothetical protein